MGFLEGFRDGRKEVRAARGRSPARPPAPSQPVAGTPSPIKVGYL
jgi:hypothetical protein